MEKIKNRMSDSGRKSQGRIHYIRKRSRTIRIVSRLNAQSFNYWTRFAIRCETLIRKPYAWNKLGLLGLRIIVKLPERFRILVLICKWEDKIFLNYCLLASLCHLTHNYAKKYFYCGSFSTVKKWFEAW